MFQIETGEYLIDIMGDARLTRFLDKLGRSPIMAFPQNVADTAMFLNIKELAVRRVHIRKNYLPGALDFHSGEFKQIEPLEVRAAAEYVDGQIRIHGTLHTRIELICARCLDSVTEEVTREFDLLYAPMVIMAQEEEAALKEGDTEIAFFEGDGLFLTDILIEQVNLAIPMKAICRSDCRGLCPHCGANLNHETCRCESHAADPRLAPLARLKQDWFKKQ